MFKRMIYRYVLNDLTRNGGLFIGRYDAVNGKKDLVNGIGIVMETIAFRVGIEVGCKFSDKFYKNMEDSEKGVD